VKGREYLARCIAPVTILVEGEGPDRTYLADGAFDMRVIGKSSCGGRATAWVSRRASRLNCWGR